MTNFFEKYKSYVDRFEIHFKDFFNNLTDCPKKLQDAMTYSAYAGGKRIRPVLLLTVNELLGGKEHDVIDFAIAIECIHTYSLIHDDLPCMDNDDFRRGQPSNHKKFGEGLAVLAGDALLNLAYEHAINSTRSKEDLQATKLLAEFAGQSGMIAGQVYDVFGNQTKSSEELNKIILNKTAKLIMAPLLIASIKNGNRYFDELYKLGEKLGFIFQIKDDILDKPGSLSIIGKTPNKDEDKNNYVNLYSIEKAEQTLLSLYNQCVSIAKNLPNNDFLIQIIDYLYKRNK